MTLVSRNTLIARLARDDVERVDASRPAIAFFFDQRGDIDRWAVVGGHGGPRDEAAPNLHEFRPPRDPFEPDPELVARNFELRTRRQARAFPKRGWNHHPTCLVDGSSHAINIPSRRLQSRYGSNSSRPAIATPIGLSVCSTSIVSP